MRSQTLLSIGHIIALVVIGLSAVDSVSVSYVDSKGLFHRISDGQKIDSIQDWAAYAQFDNSINTTGWAQLEVESNKGVDDGLQAYSMGVIEGYLTADLIDLHYSNKGENYCGNSTDFCDRLHAFIRQNLEFTTSQIEKHSTTDPFWRQIELTLLQLTGVVQGYRSARTGLAVEDPHISTNISNILVLNLLTEFGDLQEALGHSVGTYRGDDHCSAIVKVLEDGSDLLVSHNTWTSFMSMLRVMKKYTFHYENIIGRSVAFSSYPGIIYSVDDYYLISSGLTVQETTIENNNNSLWQYVKADEVVFEFLRNIVANRLARSGDEWSQIFMKYNSGTYNNQFMIVDYNKFKKGVKPSNLADGVLWILEQMPGYVEAADVTDVLRKQQYWPSYNVPYFTFIFNISNQTSLVKEYGDWFTYDKTPRALIFKRDHKNVTDVPSLYRLMRYNDFQNDPLSRCDCSPPYSAENTIAARCDLNDPSGKYPFGALSFRPHGAIDVKITTSELISNLEMIANSGPTYDDEPPFQWSKSRITGQPHNGHPDLFQFPPVHVKWSPASQTVLHL